LMEGQSHTGLLREVNVADLLGRAVVSLRASEARGVLCGKTVLVTGAAGSIGSELCRQLLDCQPAAIIGLDNNETGLFDLCESLRTHPAGESLRPRIGDITNPEDMRRLFATERPQIVFHAAAYKHVPLLEQHPDQAIRTNIGGTYNLCRLARDSGVQCFVFISTDKAADPVNVLVASKRMGGLLVEAMARQRVPKSCCS